MRLIDADALIETIAIVAKKFAKSDAQKALMGRVMYILDHKPECVVRCKECKFYEEVEYYPDGTKKICRLLKRQFHPDDFCSYGERKEE